MPAILPDSCRQDRSRALDAAKAPAIGTVGERGEDIVLA